MPEMAEGVHSGKRAVVRFLFLALGTALVGCVSSTAPQAKNEAPHLSVQRDTSCAIGDTLRLHASAVDPDGDALQYSALIEITWEELRSGYRPATDMDGQTGWFWFRPSSADLPARRVTFFAEDGRGGRDSTSFGVAIR